MASDKPLNPANFNSVTTSFQPIQDSVLGYSVVFYAGFVVCMNFPLKLRENDA